MKKRFLFLGLVTCLAMFISCANASSSSKNEENNQPENTTDNGKKITQFDLHFRTMENDDFYETEIGNNLVFYEGITQIKGVIVPVNYQNVNGTMVNAYLNNPSEYTTEFYAEDKLASQRLTLVKQNDGTYTFDIDTDTLVNGSLKKYEIRYKHKGETEVNSELKNVNISVLSINLSKHNFNCNQYFRKTRKKFIIEKNHYLNGVDGEPYHKDNDGNYIVSIYYRGVNINNISSNDLFFETELITNSIINDNQNNISKINLKVKPVNHTVTELEQVTLVCDDYCDYVCVDEN